MVENKIRVHRDVFEQLPKLYRVLADEFVKKGDIIIIEDEQQPGKERAAV